MKDKSLGVIFHPNFAPETLPEYARRAEAAGFDELWLWDDCFLPGALTSAAIGLAATQTLKFGIGLIPSVAYNPLFTAMELTTLACNFPGRILPGFGHGIASWMQQIGAKPKSSLASIEETTQAVRRLLRGEEVTFHGKQVNLDRVQMAITPKVQPPFYIGGMRPKTLSLAGRIADGAIIPHFSSPAYVRWVREQIGNEKTRLVVYTPTVVNSNEKTAMESMRQWVAEWLPWGDIQLEILKIEDKAKALLEQHGKDLSQHIPDEWVKELTAVGTPEQAAAFIQELYDAGADCVVLEPDLDKPDYLNNYIETLLPLLQ